MDVWICKSGIPRLSSPIRACQSKVTSKNSKIIYIYKKRIQILIINACRVVHTYCIKQWLSTNIFKFLD